MSEEQGQSGDYSDENILMGVAGSPEVYLFHDLPTDQDSFDLILPDSAPSTQHTGGPSPSLILQLVESISEYVGGRVTSIASASGVADTAQSSSETSLSSTTDSSEDTDNCRQRYEPSDPHRVLSSSASEQTSNIPEPCLRRGAKPHVPNSSGDIRKVNNPQYDLIIRAQRMLQTLLRNLPHVVDPPRRLPVFIQPTEKTDPGRIKKNQPSSEGKPFRSISRSADKPKTLRLCYFTDYLTTSHCVAEASTFTPTTKESGLTASTGSQSKAKCVSKVPINPVSNDPGISSGTPSNQHQSNDPGTSGGASASSCDKMSCGILNQADEQSRGLFSMNPSVSNDPGISSGIASNQHQRPAPGASGGASGSSCDKMSYDILPPRTLYRSDEQNSGLPSMNPSTECIKGVLQEVVRHISYFAYNLNVECSNFLTCSPGRFDFFTLAYETFRKEEYVKVIRLLNRALLCLDEIPDQQALCDEMKESEGFLSQLDYAYLLVRIHGPYRLDLKQTRENLEAINKTLRSIKGWKKSRFADSSDSEN